MKFHSSQNSGFTLTELMVGQLLGAIVVLAALTCLSTAVAGFREQNATAQQQDSARLAANVLVDTLRNAGYSGCNSVLPPQSVVDSHRSVLSESLANWIFDIPFISGFSSDESDAARELLGNTINQRRFRIDRQTMGDVLLLKSVVGDPMTVLQHDPTGQTLTISGNYQNKLERDQMLTINDCQNSITFAVGANPAPLYHSYDNTTVISYASDQSSNCTSTRENPPGSGLFVDTLRVDLGVAGKASCTSAATRAGFVPYTFPFGSELHRLQSKALYVGKDATSGEPTLYRSGTSNSGPGGYSEAIAEGVENLRFLYFTDTTEDNIADTVMTAKQLNQLPAQWDNVLGVRLSILVRSLNGRGVSNIVSAFSFPDVDGEFVNCESWNAATSACPDTHSSDDENPVARSSIHTDIMFANRAFR